MSATEPRGPLARDGSVVIVGAGLGGLRCAETLRNEGFGGTLTLVGAEDHLPYDRPPLTKQFLSGDWDEARIGLVTRARLDELAITHLAGVEAVALDAAGRTVRLADDTTLSGDAVVVATGAAARWLPGTEGQAGIHVVRTVADSSAVRDAFVRLGSNGRVVVIGAGFIGAEVASTAAAAALHVTVLEALPVPLSPIVGDEVGTWLTELHRRAGIEVRAGVTIEAVTGATAERGPSVRLASGDVIEADLIVVGIGVAPQTTWLDDSGLSIDNGVVTDASLFAADGVVAVGDLARFEWHHAGMVEQVRIEHWEVTTQLASAAAHALLAGRDAAQPVSLVPYFWSDQHGRKIQMLGRTSRDDETVHVAGSLDEGKFTFLYHRDGRVTAVLGLSSPRNVMVCRGFVDTGAPLDEALAAFAT